MANWSISTSQDMLFDGFGGLLSGVVDGGNVRHGGTVAGTRFQTDNLGVGTNHILATTVVSGANGNVVGAVSGAPEFAVGLQVIRKATTDIAGQSNTELQSGGSDGANRSQPIHRIETLNTLYVKKGMRNGNYNHTTGAWDANRPEIADSGGWDIAAGTASAAGDDHVANPSRGAPGQLTYRDGSAAPIQDTYKQKFG